jgi:HK97 family phage portal protein
VRVTPKTSLGLPAVYSCVRVISESFAVLPVRLYRPKVGGGRNIVTDHWLYRLLAKQPNRFQSPFEWREMMQGHLTLRGNAFNQITSNGRGEITELLPLHPDRMTLELLDNGSYRYQYIDPNGRHHLLPP